MSVVFSANEASASVGSVCVPDEGVAVCVSLAAVLTMLAVTVSAGDAVAGVEHPATHKQNASDNNIQNIFFIVIFRIFLA